MCRFLLVGVSLIAMLMAVPLRGQNGAPQRLKITVPIPIERATGERIRIALAQAIASVPRQDPAKPRVLAGEIVLPRVPADAIEIQGLANPWRTGTSDDGGRVLDRDALGAVIQANGGPAPVDPADLVTADELLSVLHEQIAAEQETEAALLLRMCLLTKENRHEPALADLDRLVAEFPQRMEYLALRSHTHQRLDNSASAERDLNSAVQLQPQSMFARAARSRFLAGRRRFKESLLDLDACLAIDPKCHEALTHRAEVRCELSQYEAALGDCNEALRLAPKSVSALAARARVHGCLEKLDEAAADYGAAIAASPEPSPALLTARANVLYIAKKYDEALRDVAEAVRLGTPTGRLLLLSAVLKGHKGDQAGARADLLEAVRVADSDVERTVYLASSLMDLDEPIAARQAYDRAAGQSATGPDELLARAVARYFTNKTELAVEDCTAALALEPQHVDSRHLRAILYGSLQEWAKAREDVTELIHRDADREALYRLRARFYEAEGKVELSLADYTKAIELDPRNVQALVQRGAVHHSRKQYSKAIDDYSAAIRLDENCVDAYRRLAQIWATCPDKDYRNGEAAVGAASRLILAETRPEPIDYALLATSYAEWGKFAEAIKYQEEALRLKPDDPRFQATEKARLELYRKGKPYHESE